MPSCGSASRPEVDATARQVERVLEATKLVGAVIAQSLVRLNAPLTAAQWRVLVLTSGNGSTATEVAKDLGIHRSNGGRLCDRVVATGLLERHVDPCDNRRVLLVHTASGRALYESALGFRRDRIREVMMRLDRQDREVVARAADLLLAAAATAGLEEADPVAEAEAESAPAGRPLVR